MSPSNEVKASGHLSRQESVSEDSLYSTINRAVTDALELHVHRHGEEKSHVLEAVLLILCLWLIILLVDYFSYAPWFNRFRYSTWYHVASSQVFQYEDKPPVDCDFLTSPIGNKGCHYKKHIDVLPPSSENGNKEVIAIYWSREKGDY